MANMAFMPFLIIPWLILPFYCAWLATKSEKSPIFFGIVSFIFFPIGTLVAISYLLKEKKEYEQEDDDDEEEENNLL